MSRKECDLLKEKITWKKILNDFKERHPRLGKEVCWWCPQDYATILIHLKDGMKITYNYDEHRATILCTRWDEH